MQGLLAQIVLVGFLFLVAHILPYSKRVDNYLAMFSLVGEQNTCPVLKPPCEQVIPRRGSHAVQQHVWATAMQLL